MITFLEGSIEEKMPTRVVLNVGGVGYEIFVPLSTSDGMPAVGEICRLLIHDCPREDQHLLFGFLRERERKAFLMLTGVSGIGPKLALTTLSGIPVQDFCHAVSAGDTRRLSSISGVGKRLAERMVVELRDRVLEISDAISAGGVSPATTDRRGGDAVAALLALGYRAAEADRMVAVAIRSLDAEATVEHVIRKALAG